MSIEVPRSLSRLVPTNLDVPRIAQRQHRNRHITVPLRRSRRRFIRRRFRLRVPKAPVRTAYMSLDRFNRLRIYSARSTARLLATEHNRRRRNERKSRRRKGNIGQLDSVRSDRFGIIGRAASRHRSPGRVADAAMLSRAIERYL